jgi:hypothetical protein
MLEQGSRKFAGIADAKFIWLSIFLLEKVSGDYLIFSIQNLLELLINDFSSNRKICSEILKLKKFQFAVVTNISKYRQWEI